MSLVPLFNLGMIAAGINRAVDNIIDQQVQKLAYIGEEFVNRARSKTPGEGSFHDRTGNLRSSIGYVVAIDGEIVVQSTPGDQPEGKEQGNMVGALLADQFSKGVVLIVYAGMEYAAAVESKGYDVITGSAPLSSEIRNIFGSIGIDDDIGDME